MEAILSNVSQLLQNGVSIFHVHMFGIQYRNLQKQKQSNQYYIIKLKLTHVIKTQTVFSI